MEETDWVFQTFYLNKNVISSLILTHNISILKKYVFKYVYWRITNFYLPYTKTCIQHIIALWCTRNINVKSFSHKCLFSITVGTFPLRLMALGEGYELENPLKHWQHRWVHQRDWSVEKKMFITYLIFTFLLLVG